MSVYAWEISGDDASAIGDHVTLVWRTDTEYPGLATTTLLASVADYRSVRDGFTVSVTASVSVWPGAGLPNRSNTGMIVAHRSFKTKAAAIEWARAIAPEGATRYPLRRARPKPIGGA